MYVNFEVLSESIDIEEFVTQELGIEIMGVSGDSFIIDCANPLHLDKHPSCYLHKTELMWHCFGCSHSGNLIDLTERYLDISRLEAVDLLKSKLGLEVDATTDKLKKRFIEKDLPEFELSSGYRRDWENAPAEVKNFMKRRNFNQELFSSYFIGYNSRLVTITMPVIYKKKIINIGERFILGNSDTKIKYKKGSPLSKNVWGLFDGYNKDNPFFTEGIFDAIRMREAGYNAFALLSNQLSDAKLLFLIRHFSGEFTIVPDNDAGGETMKDNWRKALHMKSASVVNIEKYKDIDEVPIDEIHKLVNKRTKLKVKESIIENNMEVCDHVRF